MANISQQGLFNAFMPEVMIQKITLENAGFVPVESNPHIKDEREEKEFIQTPDSMKVSLSLIVKEKFDDDLFGKWLGSIDLKKYITIKLYQSTDPSVSKLATVSNESIRLFENSTFWGEETRIARNYASRLLGTQNDTETWEKINNSIKLIDISLLDEKTVENEINDDGTETQNVFYKASFDLATSQPKHLSYFALTTFDIEKLSQDFNLKNPLEDKYTSVYAEKVIDNYQTIAQSFVYLKEDGSVWTGPVYVENDLDGANTIVSSTYKTTANTEITGSTVLKRLAVSNSKIQDFRNDKEIKKLKLDFQKIRKAFNRLGDRRDIVVNPRTENYFKLLSFESDGDRNCNISFVIEPAQMVASSSKYKNFFISFNTPLANTAMRGQIRSLKVLRKRVKKYGHSKQAYVDFHKNQIEEIVAYSADRGGKIITQDNEKAFLSEIPLQDARMFILTDRQMPYITDGLYQYGIEVEIDDPLEDKLKNILKDLNNEKIDLEKYYREASKLSRTKAMQQSSNPHFKTQLSQARTEVIEGNYNPLTNSFTTSFKTKMAEQDQQTSIWTTSVATFCNSLSYFIEDLDSELLSGELQKIVNPQTGNPSGIGLLLSLYETLISRMNSVISLDKKVNNLLSTDNARSRKTSFKMKHWFKDEAHDADKDDTISFKFFDESVVPESRTQELRTQGILDKTQNNKRGLLSITRDQLNQRAEQETLKFFNSANPDINDPEDNTSTSQIGNINLSYFTPNVISTRNNQYAILENSPIGKDLEDSSKIESKLEKTNKVLENFKNISVSSTNSDDVVIVTQDFQILENTLRNFIKSIGSAHSVTIELEKKKQKEDAAIDPIQVNSIGISALDDISQQTTNDAGGLSRFVSALATDLDHSIPTKNNFSSGINPFANTPTDKTILTTNSIQFDVNSMTSEEKSELPLQIQAQFLESKGKSSVKDTKNKNSISKEIDVSAIKELRMLSGFEKGEDGRKLLNKPIWEKVTREKLNSMDKTKDIVLKMFDYDNTSVKTKSNFIKKAESIDSTFILKGEGQVSESEMDRDYIIEKQNYTISLPKKTIDEMTKMSVEQSTFPPYSTKTEIANTQSFKEILTDENVKKKLRKKEIENFNKNVKPKNVIKRGNKK